MREGNGERGRCEERGGIPLLAILLINITPLNLTVGSSAFASCIIFGRFAKSSGIAGSALMT